MDKDYQFPKSYNGKSTLISTDYSKLTLGELLSSQDDIIKRNATSILKQLQRQCEYYPAESGVGLLCKTHGKYKSQH